MPTYTFRCGNCGDQDFWQSIHEDPLSECGCGSPLTKVLTPPYVSVYATPNKGLDARRVDRKESGWDRDMAAYRRLRHNGTQPPKIDGSAEIEAKCETKDEVEHGRPLSREHREMLNEAKQVVMENGGTW